MVGWLGRKAENSRLYMCIKELKWDLEISNQTKRARILVTSQFLRTELERIYGFNEDIISKPIMFLRDDLMELYRIFESDRNTSNLRLKTLRKNYTSLRKTLPEFAVEHAMVSIRAVEVWMCTIAIGIIPDRRPDVVEIWSYLFGSMPLITVAFHEIKDLEKSTAEISDALGTVRLSHLELAEVRAMCAFVPAVLTKEF